MIRVEAVWLAVEPIRNVLKGESAENHRFLTVVSESKAFASQIKEALTIFRHHRYHLAVVLFRLVKQR